jgi:hypothetical protein
MKELKFFAKNSEKILDIVLDCFGIGVKIREPREEKE